MSLKCAKCRKVFAGVIEIRNAFPGIPDLMDRIVPGEEVPSGECPVCGALVYVEGNGADVVCNVCGDEVELPDIRTHLRMHNPNAEQMSWEGLRAVFTGNWDH